MLSTLPALQNPSQRSLASYKSRIIRYIHVYTCITQYGSTVYIGIAMVFVFSPYIREIQFLLSVSSQFDF